MPHPVSMYSQLMWSMSHKCDNYVNVHRTFVTDKWHLQFLMEPVCQTQLIVKTRRFNLLKTKQLRFAYVEGFILYASQRWEGSPKQMQLSWFFAILALVSDWFKICPFPDDPDFHISGFPIFGFSFPVYVSTCIRPCRAGWMEGLFEVVALKSQFSDPKWKLLNWFSNSRANSHRWKVVLQRY